ncbi:D-proline reductase (dithiol) PrdD [Lachnospiraceae bacterium PF1-21]
MDAHFGAMNPVRMHPPKAQEFAKANSILIRYKEARILDGKETILRRLVIKAFHIDEVSVGEENSAGTTGVMTVNKDVLASLSKDYPEIESIDLQVIAPGDHDRYTNTIMDIIPISTKVLGNIGEGITHTLTGVYVMLTGVDTVGKQTHEFGSSEGNLKEQLYLNRAGTPGDDDYIISFDVTLKAGMGQERHGVDAAHNACDRFVQIFRNQLKKFKGDLATERHEFYDKIKHGKKRVAIIKQVAGQGAMYDMQLFAKEPSGMEGGRSIIDLGNMPVIVTPNEYRDGIIRSKQ